MRIRRRRQNKLHINPAWRMRMIVYGLYEYKIEWVWYKNIEITLRIQNKMSAADNRTKNSPEQLKQETNSIAYLKKLCESIQHEINSMIELITTKKIPELTESTIEKYLTSMKQAIGRAITMRFPQVMAVEEKYQNLAISVSEELDQQKRKTREINKKYEDKILENDKLKVQIVEMNQNYLNIMRDYESNQNRVGKMEREINYLNEKIAKQEQEYSQNTVTHAKLKIQEQSLQHKLSILTQQLEYHQQQKILFQNELTNLQQELEHLKLVNQTQATKIDTLETDKIQLESLLHNQKQNNSLLHEELKNQVIEKQKMKEEFIMSQQTIKKLEKDQEVYLNSIKQQKNKYIQEKSEHILQLDQINKQKSALEKTITELKEQKQNVRTVLKDKQFQLQRVREKVVILKQQFDRKIESILKNKNELESKFNEKYLVLKRREIQLMEKTKKFKSENERLYEAMEQYAKEELKMKKKYDKIQGEKDSIENRFRKQKQKLKELLIKIHVLFEKNGLRQINQMRVSLKQIKQGILEEGKNFHRFLERQSASFWPKLQDLGDGKLRAAGELQREIEMMNIENRQLKNKICEYETNSTKVVSALIEGKELLLKQIHEKELKIKELMEEIEAQKQNYRLIVNRFEKSLKKYTPEELPQTAYSYQNYHNYQKYSQQNPRSRKISQAYSQPHTIYPNQPLISNPNHHNNSNILSQTLDEQISKQQQRFQALQKEYSQVFNIQNR